MLSAFNEMAIWAAISAMFVAALTTVGTFLNPSNKSTEHQNSGNSYLALRNRARLFRNIELSDMAIEEAKSRLLALSQQRDELNAACPAVPEKMYTQVKKKIEAGQASYSVDAD